jgi:hypothetical protein
MVIRVTTVMVAWTIACGLLGPGAPAPAEAGDRHCSNRTLRGDYGFTIEGWILPDPTVPVHFPLRGVAMTRFDGRGSLAQVDHAILNGARLNPTEEWSPGSGTYEVNPDCTGSGRINFSDGSFVELRFVVVKAGKEINTVVTTPFAGPARTVTSRGIKVD